MRDGLTLGIGAGQQSRVGCTRPAGANVDTWWLRRHPAVRALDFRPEIRRQERINWQIRFIEVDLTEDERQRLALALREPAAELTGPQREQWRQGLTGVAFASDGALPFRGNVDHAQRHGVAYLAEPGGSVRSGEVEPPAVNAASPSYGPASGSSTTDQARRGHDDHGHDAGVHVHHFVRPHRSPPVNGYSHAVAFTGPTVAVSGQVPLNAEGTIVGESDPAAQIRQVFSNLATALQAAGARFQDVVKLTVYLTDLADLDAFRRIRDEHLDPDRPPACSLVKVAGLVHPAFRVEIDALAVLPGAS